MATRDYTAPNRINLGGPPGGYTHEECTASESITPGHLIEYHTSSGKKVRKHATAKGFALKMFAVEDPLIGRTIDDVYASGELVAAHIVLPGTIIFAYLAPGTNYVHGDYLESAGNGTLRKVSGSADLQMIAILQEAVDLSASGAVTVRKPVQIL